MVLTSVVGQFSIRDWCISKCEGKSGTSYVLIFHLWKSICSIYEGCTPMVSEIKYLSTHASKFRKILNCAYRERSYLCTIRDFFPFTISFVLSRF